MMTDEMEPQPAPARLSDTTLAVRYFGTSNFRILNERDLSGDKDAGTEHQLIWEPGTEIAWSVWLELAGSDERALDVLGRHNFEFKLVGPGADAVLAAVPEEEEFSIEGSVA